MIKSIKKKFFLLNGSTLEESSWIRICMKDPSSGGKKTPKKCKFTDFNGCPKIKNWGFSFEKL